jgi:carbon storage regulator
MLVLSRKEQQEIVLEGGITITVVRVNGGTVRLGIDAFKEVPIRRAELLTLDDSQLFSTNR